MQAAGNAEQARQALVSLHPIGHLGEPMDVAYGVLYLASDESKFVTLGARDRRRLHGTVAAVHARRRCGHAACLCLGGHGHLAHRWSAREKRTAECDELAAFFLENLMLPRSDRELGHAHREPPAA